MKRYLSFIFLLFIVAKGSGQVLRTFVPVTPLKIIQNQTDNNKFATLVKRTYNSGTVKYYYLSSNESGDIKALPFRYGDVVSDTTGMALPANFLAYFDCGFVDRLVVGTWAFDNFSASIQLRYFNGAWWTVQMVNGLEAQDAFQPRGINFLSRGDVTITNPTSLDLRCLARLSNQVTGFEGLVLTPNFTTPTGYEYVSDGEYYRLIGSPEPPPVGTREAYVSAVAEVFWDNNNNTFISDKLMDLQLTENGGVWTLTDNSTYFNRNIAGTYNWNGGAYKQGQLVEHNGQVYYASTDISSGVEPPNGTWQAKTLEKRYFISFNTSATQGYTAAQMQAGIDVSAWKGQEITVFMAYFPTTGELSYLTPSEQQMYIGGLTSTNTYSTGTYYNYHPSQFTNATDRVFRFNEYMANTFQVPANKRVIIDALNELENTNKTTYANVGVYSKTSTVSNYKYAFVSDAWLESLDHPCAYFCGGQSVWDAWWQGVKDQNGGLAGATNFVKNKFITDVANTYASYNYVMLNNELKYFWNAEFQNVIKQCYDYWDANNTGILSGWLSATVTVAPTLDKARAWTDWNDTRTIDQKAADPTMFSQFLPSSHYRYSLQVNQTGNYFNDRTANNLGNMIASTMYSKKFNTDQIVVPTLWNNVETITQPLGYYQELWYGRPVKTTPKATVSPHIMRNYAAAACFFGDGLHIWHDGYVVANTAPNYYPWYITYMDTNESINQVGATARPWTKETNIDGAMNGVWAIYQHPNFEDVTVQIADVNDGSGWRTGADAFVVGAMVDSKPFAAYKRIGNQYLVYAIDFYGKTVKDVTIRMKDANNNDVTRTIQLRGDNASIIKFTI